MNKNTEIIKQTLAKRYAKERRFRALGMVSVFLGLMFLLILLLGILVKATPAFTQHYLSVDMNYDASSLGVSSNPSITELEGANYRSLIRNTLYAQFPEVTQRKDKRELAALISGSAEYQIRDTLLANPGLLNQSTRVQVLLDDDVDTYLKNNAHSGRVSEQQISWINTLEKSGTVERNFNRNLFTNGDSREPESAGLLGATMGSLYALTICLLVSFPIGVMAAIYLEEFAPKNRWIDLIEININNLAAVPSIVFGLLGLAVFLNFFGMPRSAPLVGGLVLALLTLPTIIIASRSAIKSVPPSIREAALGLGASKMQTVFQHVVPLAMPGILTGAIIGSARALGEAAPLLMIGMVAFIVDVPQGFTDPSTVLPIQIFLWADSPERAFIAMTSAATIVLLIFLICMNGLAIWLRKRFEKQW